ncbi:tRNA/rRNA methyltransferase (SpoU) [Beutenbergia cavernae DSM 12333]|uniref:tRNA/rRNA methyltransferase (SpoU) n=1 Tax=Beutenbergia cavernae (strain ATCC BAA-8 / DSM 12333 / CCUG 43141 / JCM 11478 / NBRC 16432 / NCIMB 13614 / HKI 0122) TaxID=471853 RepID=C5BW31_BEUC1|nr:RNA methyltransferase [Beutenbergia cavernae]ACQ80632.1 tRNA/rRNA methyltransferase (SpoU) [Beutenbergia cavernae DSM 12333]
MASVRALAGRSSRQRHGRFLVEGPQAVREAVLFAASRLRDLYVTRAALERYPEIVDAARAADRFVHPVTDEVMARLSGDAQGIIAVVDAAEHSLDDVVSRAPRLVAVCAQIRDPGNAGTVIRAADAAGADAVVLTTGSVEATSPKVVRSSAGSLFHLPVVTGVTLQEAVAALRSAHLAVLAADASGTTDVETAPLAAPSAWVFGTEAQGLTADELALADAVVRVPLRGHAESLNVAMAATVCLYASSRAQHVPG